MTRVRLIVLVGLFALCCPAGAYAQSDFLDWLDSFSGPGPFHGVTIGMRTVCLRDNAGKLVWFCALSGSEDVAGLRT